METIEDIRKFGVLVLCTGIYPDTIGGAEVHLFYMCKELAERGHHVFVISPAHKFSRGASDRNIPFVRVRLKLWSRPFFILSYIVKSLVVSLKLKDQIEMVHVHTANFPMVVAFIFSAITRKPYVVACRGSDIRMSSRKLLRRIFRIPFLYNAKKLVVVSNEISKILRRKYGIPKSQIVVVGNAYDHRITEKLVNTKLSPSLAPAESERSMRIINVANLRPEKDHITLLEGFTRLAKSIKEVRLSIVGDGPLRSQLEQFCTQQGLHNVKFLGTLPHKDALERIATSDIFILTSVEEGMPNVIIEALALGKPVIATAVGGIPEVVREEVNGILVPPKSPEHVAKALERLLSDSKLRRKLGKAAAESVKDRLWSKIVEKYERIYKTLL